MSKKKLTAPIVRMQKIESADVLCTSASPANESYDGYDDSYQNVWS